MFLSGGSTRDESASKFLQFICRIHFLATVEFLAARYFKAREGEGGSGETAREKEREKQTDSLL